MRQVCAAECITGTRVGWAPTSSRAAASAGVGQGHTAVDSFHMILIGIFNDHDACAAVFDDYRMISARAQERMSRIKDDGFSFPAAAVDECLAAANLSRSDVDVVAMSLGIR